MAAFRLQPDGLQPADDREWGRGDGPGPSRRARPPSPGPDKPEASRSTPPGRRRRSQPQGPVVTVPPAQEPVRLTVSPGRGRDSSRRIVIGPGGPDLHVDMLPVGFAPCGVPGRLLG